MPTEHAATIALRTQQIIAHETGVTDVVDPLGGSSRRVAHRRAGGARRGADRANRRAGRGGGGDGAGLRPGGDRAPRTGAAGRRVRRRASSSVSMSTSPSRRRRFGCSRSIPRPSAASMRAPRRCAVNATQMTRQRRLQPCVRRLEERRTYWCRCARPCEPAARSARSAACCARSGASTTENARRADPDAHPARLPDVSGAGRPGPRHLCRARGARLARTRARDRVGGARPQVRRESALSRAASACAQRCTARRRAGLTSSCRPASSPRRSMHRSS